MPDLQYSNWTQPVAPQHQLTEAQAQKLASKLKTYINSTKFIKPGTKLQVTGQEGQSGKVPLSQVTYYNNPDMDDGIDANQLQSRTRQAILTKDPQQLKQVAGYNYFTAVDTAKQAQSQRNINAWRLTALALLLGGAGAGAGYKVSQFMTRNQTDNTHKLKHRLLSMLAGAATGISGAGFINSYFNRG